MVLLEILPVRERNKVKYSLTDDFMIADEEENPEIQVSVEKNKVEDKTLEEMS